MTRLLANRDAALAAIVVALVLLIGARSHVFLSPASIVGVLTDTSFLFMLTLAQMAIILTRGIDLSVAANVGLVGMLSALASRAHPDAPIALIILMAIGLGALLGAINGALIAGFSIPPIVVTLGTLSIYRGAIFLIAGGAWLTSKDMTPAFLAFHHFAISAVRRRRAWRHRCWTEGVSQGGRGAGTHRALSPGCSSRTQRPMLSLVSESCGGEGGAGQPYVPRNPDSKVVTRPRASAKSGESGGPVASIADWILT